MRAYMRVNYNLLGLRVIASSHMGTTRFTHKLPVHIHLTAQRFQTLYLALINILHAHKTLPSNLSHCIQHVPHIWTWNAIQ